MNVTNKYNLGYWKHNLS
uniref:Uncharacterized protein n=1 Tax=Moniliophthora roreri TaxID=221103 RepID=A0A0W0G6P7_MONRR